MSLIAWMITIMYLKLFSSNFNPRLSKAFLFLWPWRTATLIYIEFKLKRLHGMIFKHFNDPSFAKRNRNSSHLAVKSISFLLLIALLFCSFYAVEAGFFKQGIFLSIFFWTCEVLTSILDTFKQFCSDKHIIFKM